MVNSEDGVRGKGGMGGVEKLVEVDMSRNQIKHHLNNPTNNPINKRVDRFPLVCDEQFLPFRSNSFDLALSNLSLHWCNDIKGVFSQVMVWVG